MKLFFICLFLCVTPFFSHAAITINEVAWMGNAVSSNDEWIELYNDSVQGIDMDGWHLSDGVSLDISLTGTVAAEQYVVLERTDDSSAPGSAFMIYSGGLVNTGATLSLYRSDDALEDRVVGGEGWENIGGDNVTKETAQYTTGGWVTAEATPGKVNGKEDVVPESEEEEDVPEEGDETDSSTSASTLYTVPREVYLNIEVPGRVYVHQAVSMSVVATGLSDGVVNSLAHTWNFGDFTVGSGEEVVHRFEYPGEYVVTLHSQYKDYEAYARQTIVVLPVSFSMTINQQGDVQVHNDARYEVDVSGYKIAAGKTLRFPEGTILLPNATITIPKERLQYTNNATLFDETATQVASIVPARTQEREVVAVEEALFVPTPVAYAPLVELPEPVNTNFTFADEITDKEAAKLPIGKTYGDEGGLQIAAPIEATESLPEGKLPYFALLAVIGLGVIAVFAGRVRS